MDLSQHATAVTGGFLDALPYFILVGLVVVTGFMQARQSRRNAPNMNSQMAIITSILPIGFGLFSLQFPAGLVLYFLVSNLWRLGQQEIIMRKITRPGQAALATTKDDAIDVKGVDTDTSAFPRAAGGLRKLFQLPAATNGEGGETTGGNGANGAAKPTADQPSSSKPSGGAKGSSAKGSPGASAGSGSSGGGSSSGARRRNNKKRKRR
jgi:YidC/Oxa1 family membrane protein insertase